MSGGDFTYDKMSNATLLAVELRRVGPVVALDRVNSTGVYIARVSPVLRIWV